MKKRACFNIPCTQSLSFRGWSLKQCRCHEHCGAVCRRATVSSALSLLASYTDMMCLTKAAGRSSNIQLPGNSKKKKKRKWNGLKSGLTLIVHTAVLVLLAGHKGINLWLAHLLSCGCTTIHVRDMFPISLTIAC